MVQHCLGMSKGEKDTSLVWHSWGACFCRLKKVTQIYFIQELNSRCICSSLTKDPKELQDQCSFCGLRDQTKKSTVTQNPHAQGYSKEEVAVNFSISQLLAPSRAPVSDVFSNAFVLLTRSCYILKISRQSIWRPSALSVVSCSATYGSIISHAGSDEAHSLA